MAYRCHNEALACRRDELEAELYAIEGELADYEQLNQRAEQVHQELRAVLQQLEPQPRKRGRMGCVLGAFCGTGMLMALCLGAYWLIRPSFVRSHQRTASVMARNVRTVAVQFMALNPSAGCPTARALIDARELEPSALRDPWGSRFRIRCSAEDITVSSPGRDGRFGSPDDVVVGPLVQ